MISEAQFIQLWNEAGGSAAAVARSLGISERAVHGRRARIEAAKGITLTCPDYRSNRPQRLPPGRLTLDLPNGTVIVGSDAHIWSTDLTTAQRAFLQFSKKLKPDAIVMNGDVFDGARISRHPNGIWSQEQRPNVKQELEACQSFLDALVKAYPAKRYWLWGNHDARFEMRLSSLTPEFEGVRGFALKDHFQEWTFGMSLWVNECVIKHRASHSGLHAVYNNTLKGGKSVVTGHLHSLKVTPWTDWGGDRYGVDCGTLADVNGPQFDYMEDNAKSWRSGFVVLTFKGGRLLHPELVQVFDEDHVQFRGELVKV